MKMKFRELRQSTKSSDPEGLRNFKMAELLLDSAIRVWVILPIVMITFFVGIIRHYLSILLQSNKKAELEQVSDGYVLIYKINGFGICLAYS